MLSMGCVYMCTTRLYRDRAYSGPKGESGDLYGVPVCQCPWLIAIVGHYTFFMAISVLTRLWKVFKGGRWMAHLTSSAYRSIPHTNCPGRVVIDGVSAPIGVQTHACTVYLCTYPLYVHILCTYTLYTHTYIRWCICTVLTLSGVRVLKRCWVPIVVEIEVVLEGGLTENEPLSLVQPSVHWGTHLWSSCEQHFAVWAHTCRFSTGWWMRG